MLLRKAWLESRTRFLYAAAAMVGVSILYVYLHPILIPQWRLALADPHALKPKWLPIGVSDYRFYIWHFLYDYHLQNLWVAFAILLGFGGLFRENAHGTALFSLSLPVSRTRWLVSRCAVAFGESLVLALLPVPIAPIASLFIGERYPFTQALAHGCLMAAAGSVFLAFACLLSLLVRGAYGPLAATVAVVMVPYIVLQEWTRVNPASGISTFDVAHVMAGPWLLTWSSVPWPGVAAFCVVTLIILMISVRRSRQIEF